MAGAEGGSACAAPPAVAAVDEEAPAPPPAAVPADAAPSAMRAFLRLVAVQQTLLLLVGSLFYDAGSIACDPARRLDPWRCV